MAAENILFDAFIHRREKYRHELKTCRAEFSREAVHDLRVSVRRLLAVFDVLRTNYHPPRLQRIRRDLKAQLDDLDELRDVQVLLADVSEYIHEVPSLSGFREYLSKKERNLLQKARKQVHSIKTSPLFARLDKGTEMIAEIQEKGERYSLYDILDSTYARACQKYVLIDSEKPSTVHKLRIAFKKFRYTLEIASPMLTAFPEENFERMHEYQARMGDIQDLEVTQVKLTELMDQDPALDLQAAQLHYTTRLRQSLFHFLEDRGELFNFWRTAPGLSFPWEN